MLEALAREPSHELTCAEIAGLIGRYYHPTYRILRQLFDDGIVATRNPRPGDQHRSRHPYRLTEAGLAHVDGLPQPNPTPPPEPLITAITSQILLALLQPPIRGWQFATLANRARCHPNTVLRFGRQMERAGWATARAQTEHPGDILLTDHGVTHATAALQREYGDSPALLLLANAMCPPVKLVEV